MELCNFIGIAQRPAWLTCVHVYVCAGLESAGSDTDVFASVQSLEALVDQAHRVEEMCQQHILFFHSEFKSAGSARAVRFSSSIPNGGLVQPALHGLQDARPSYMDLTDGQAPVNLRDIGDAHGLLGIERARSLTSKSDASSADSFVSANMQFDVS